MDRPVLLGLAGDYTHADTCSPSHYATKVGGLAWLPGSAPPALASQGVHCRACDSLMALVVQAYAPLTLAQHGQDQPDRTLLVYACCAPGCGRLPGSWRAFTCHVPPTPPLLSEPKLPAASHTQQQPGAEASCTASRAGVGATSLEARSTAAADLQPKPTTYGFEEDTFGFVQEAAAAVKGSPEVPGLSAGTGVKAVAGFEDSNGFGFEDQAFGSEGFGSDAPGGAAAEGSAFDFADLDAALEQSAAAATAAATAAAATRKAAKGKKEAANTAGTASAFSSAAAPAVPTCVPAQEGPLLPEFYLYAEEEPQGASGGPGQAHVQHLLQEYEQQEQQAGSTAATTTTASKQQQQGGNAQQQQGGSSAKQRQQQAGPSQRAGEQPAGGVSDDDEAGSSGGGDDMSMSWAGEEYEEDRVRGVHGAYLKYSNVLQRQPAQCVRYCRGGRPLWPLSQPPDPSARCPTCDAELTFELQVMAPIISLLMEAALEVGVAEDTTDQGPGVQHAGAHSQGQVQGAGGTGSLPSGQVALPASRQALNGAANWDLCTVAVFTCSQACQGIQDQQRDQKEEQGQQSAVLHKPPVAVWTEAAAIVVNEDDCHVPIR